MKRTVRVPATTANLGPGFDSFGCALGLYNTYTFEAIDGGLEISGCAEKYCNPKNLSVRAYELTLREAGVPYTGLRMEMLETQVPVSRGLGSSAAMIVAGVVAANAEAGYPFDNRKMLELATRIEGHPDNLAPAFYGGLTASMMNDGIPDTVTYKMAEGLRFVVCIPTFELPTAKARKALPETYSRADAVYNLSHGAVLLKALETGDKPVISRALNDRLHQPYRFSLIPEYETVRRIALESGAIAFCISGAGPTLLALTDDRNFAGRLSARLAKETQKGWKVLSPDIDRHGAIVTEE
ncbi:MAG: homoserine kinase [Clostridia bacterium]|nr:homoserine kinase [Clostridia bacterium]